jgi:hypothetical protein
VGVLGVGNKASDYDDADVKVLQDFVNGCQKYLPADEVEAIVG